MDQIDENVKRFVDEGDVRSLRFVFLDCLDVDPTFESYRREYEYSRDVPGLLEAYKELAPLKTDSGAWDQEYWLQLKGDLRKNFAEKRFLHMIEVAKVVKADKVRRLQEERLAKNRAKLEGEKRRADSEVEVLRQKIEVEQARVELQKEQFHVDQNAEHISEIFDRTQEEVASKGKQTKKQEQEERLAKKRAEIEASNRQAEAVQLRQKNEVEQARLDLKKEEKNGHPTSAGKEDPSSKKAEGNVVLIVLAIVVVVAIVLLLLLR